MADTRISALPTLTTLADADIVPVSQSGTTKGAAASTFKTYIGVGGTTLKVTGSDFTTTSVSLVDITGLSFSAAINTTYEIECTIRTQSTDSGGNKFRVTYSTSLATGEFIFLGGNAQTTLSSAAQSLGNNPGVQFSTTINTDNTLKIWGVVRTGANTGNIKVQTCQNTGGTCTIYIGSRMTVTQLS